MYENKSKSCKFKKTEKEKTMKRQAKQKKFNPDHLAFIERLKSLESQSADKVNCSHFCNEFYNDRFKAKIDGDCIPNIYTLRDWFHAYHLNQSFSVNAIQVGRKDSHVKLDHNVIPCYICIYITYFFNNRVDRFGLNKNHLHFHN